MFKRSCNEDNLKRFNDHSLSNTNWSMLLKEEDSNESHNGFIGGLRGYTLACWVFLLEIHIIFV